MCKKKYKIIAAGIAMVLAHHVYAANVSIMGTIADDYGFDPITELNYQDPEEKSTGDVAFATDNSSQPIQLSLQPDDASQYDNNSTWMTNGSPGSTKVYYQVIYTTCKNPSGIQQTVNLSTNTASGGGITFPVPHTSSIPGEYAWDILCQPGFGGSGQLTFKRMDLATEPDAGQYSATFTLEVSAP